MTKILNEPALMSAEDIARAREEANRLDDIEVTENQDNRASLSPEPRFPSDEFTGIYQNFHGIGLVASPQFIHPSALRQINSVLECAAPIVRFDGTQLPAAQVAAVGGDPVQGKQDYTMAAYYGENVPQTDIINTMPPFVSPLNGRTPDAWGVVKITNIPYAVTIQELSHFIGRLSRVPLITPHVHGFPVHVVIERPTAKTLEIYVEFHTVEDARTCVHRAEEQVLNGRPLRIGTRLVSVELSNQGQMMSSIFPRARYVHWDPATGAPQVRAVASDREGFRGFFTVEEISSVVRHAENPHRSPFAARCLQRGFESMISTLYKFPWLAAGSYTVAARDFLFSSYMAQLQVLVAKIAPGGMPMFLMGGEDSASADREVGLSHQLLMDFLFAGMNAVCFSMRQKWQITHQCGPLGAGFPLSRHAFAWPFQCLVPSYGTTDRFLEFWLNILVDGFDVIKKNKISHDFQKCVELKRDNLGFLTLQYTPDGNALCFQDAIIMEQALLTLMAEKGRMKWCVTRDLYYEPLAISQYVTPAQFEQQHIDNDLNRLDLEEYAKAGVQSKLAGREEGYCGRIEQHLNDTRPVHSEAFETQLALVNATLDLFRINQEHVQQMSNSAIAPEHSGYEQRRSFAIDPRSPEFIPSGTMRQVISQNDVLDHGPVQIRSNRASFLDGISPIHQNPQDLEARSTQAYEQSCMLQSEVVGSHASDAGLVNDQSTDTQSALISTAPKTHTRRRTITVDSTIEEEVEGPSHEHMNSNHTKSFSDNVTPSSHQD